MLWTKWWQGVCWSVKLQGLCLAEHMKHLGHSLYIILVLIFVWDLKKLVQKTFVNFIKRSKKNGIITFSIRHAFQCRAITINASFTLTSVLSLSLFNLNSLCLFSLSIYLSIILFPCMPALAPILLMSSHYMELHLITVKY